MRDIMLEALLEWSSSEKKRRRFMNKIGLRILAAQVMRNAYERFKNIDPDPTLCAEADGQLWWLQQVKWLPTSRRLKGA
jgi:hypothetical protein